MVSALGLMRTGRGRDYFSAVSKDSWYYDAVSITYENGIIVGKRNGQYKPKDYITPDQAMCMIARAMKITGLEIELSDSEMNKLFSSFDDSTKTQKAVAKIRFDLVRVRITKSKYFEGRAFEFARPLIIYSLCRLENNWSVLLYFSAIICI